MLSICGIFSLLETWVFINIQMCHLLEIKEHCVLYTLNCWLLWKIQKISKTRNNFEIFRIHSTYSIHCAGLQMWSRSCLTTAPNIFVILQNVFKISHSHLTLFRTSSVKWKLHNHSTRSRSLENVIPRYIYLTLSC
jgi:hypothetical protein